MSRRCDICGKESVSGYNVSHAHNVTKRVFRPNLQNVRIMESGAVKHIKACTKCIKSGKITKV